MLVSPFHCTVTFHIKDACSILIFHTESSYIKRKRYLRSVASRLGVVQLGEVRHLGEVGLVAVPVCMTVEDSERFLFLFLC